MRTLYLLAFLAIAPTPAQAAPAPGEATPGPATPSSQDPSARTPYLQAQQPLAAAGHAAYLSSSTLGALQGRIYDGGAAPSSQFSKGIAGTGSAQQYNLSVCHSGGLSGTHCGLVVRDWGWIQPLGRVDFVARYDSRC